MTTCIRRQLACLILICLFAMRCEGVELRVSRDALERTLRQQLFSGPDGRYYLRGTAKTACYVYGDDPHLIFQTDRILVRMKAHARLGKSVAGACLGIALSPEAEVSMAPVGEGESIGFKDARLERASDQAELNFILTPFLSRQVPSSLKVDAAELLRKALAGSTASSGYKVTLDRLKIHSVQIDGDELVVDADGDLSVK
jgi:hypothetical protein